MGKFLKGHKTNVGIKRRSPTAETRLKWSIARRGRKWTAATREKMKSRVPWNKGKKGVQPKSPETIEKIRQRMIGNQYTKGWTFPLEIRRRFGSKGEKHPNWKGGVTPVHVAFRKSMEYKLWRKAVFERDGYACVLCGHRGTLNADHIKRFSEYPELRLAIDNGRTLCVPCHRTTETWGTRGLKLKK